MNKNMLIRVLILSLIIVMVVAGAMRFMKDAPEIEIQPPKEKVQPPFDHVKKEQIHVYYDHVRMDIENPGWAIFTKTHSMLPVFDEGHNAIQIRPNSTIQIHVGDIISYRSKYYETPVIHRVVKLDQDEQGWYALLKGDNNIALDPGKVRFDDIVSITVGLIY